MKPLVRNWALLIVLMSMATALACSEPATPAQVPTSSLVLPLQISVRQRTTTPAPESEGRLLITVDDVTRGQVMTSVAERGGATLLPLRSMSPRDEATFRFDGRLLTLRLEKLDNALIGDDVATFEIFDPGAPPTESQKIDRLIRSVAESSDVRFIRNGGSYSAAEAAAHLKSKRAAAGDKIATARQFIDEIAAKSSVSGRPYQIRFADGRVIDASAFFDERLREIEQGR